ncbi:MAG: DUF1206 domain-containing protein [Candidatus Dormibacteraceae bacterium]
MADTSVKHEAQKAGQEVESATRNPLFRLLARFGYVVRGVLYAYMGYTALRIAMSGGSQKADQQSSLVAISGFPLGRYLLIAGIVSIAAYALWGFIRAIFDPLHRGDDAKGIVTRLGFAWSGLAYTALTFFAVGLLTHGGGSGADGSMKTAQSILNAPAGKLLLELAGLIGIAAGLGQFFDAYKASFKKDLKRGEMSEAEKRTTDALGRAGFIARGIVFLIMGWFIFLAARQHNPGQVKGFTGAFTYLLTQPYGRPLLALVALGFIALGLHSVVLARYIRMPGDTG